MRFLLYVIACQIYTIRLFIYWFHSFLVFLSKPGARLIVPILILAAIYLLRQPLRTAIGPEVDAIWKDVVPAFIGVDLATVLASVRLEISALALLAVFFIFFLLFASMLRPIMGALWAPQEPLPPQLAMRVPDTSVPRVAVERLIGRRRYRRLDAGLATLSARLPDHLKAVLQARPQRTEEGRHLAASLQPPEPPRPLLPEAPPAKPAAPWVPPPLTRQ